MKTSDLITYLDALLQPGRFVDRSLNGLQVQGPAECARVAFAVDGCLETFQAAIAAGAQLLIVHHGLFWGEPIALTGAHLARIRALLEGGVGLYASHLPLDAHPTLGNNAELARIAGLGALQPWSLYKGNAIGCIGDLTQPLTLAALARRLARELGPALRVAGNAPCKRVAVCSGFGVDRMDEALAAGADTLITGETSHQWHHPVAESGLNVIYCGHYASETTGLKALARELARALPVTTHFIDLPTGL